MTKSPVNAIAFFSLCIMACFASTECFGQSDAEIADVKNLPIAKNWATLTGYGYSKILYISKDSLKHDLKIKLWDTTYKIKFFRMFHTCEDCDIRVETIIGNTIKLQESRILRGLTKDDILQFYSFKTEQSGKFYTLPEFTVFVTD